MNHFFSYQTHVSFELPFGWDVQEEKKDAVTYVYDLEDDMDEDEMINADGGKFFNPIYSIDRFAMPGTDPMYIEKAIQSVLDQPLNDKHIFEQKKCKVDQHPGSTVIFEYRDNDYGSMVVRHQSFVLVDNVLYSFSGFMPKELFEQGGEMFEHALGSVRFIFTA